MMGCLYCGKEVPQQVGKRKKEYCTNVCRQLAYRKRKHNVTVTPVDDLEAIQRQQQEDQHEALLAELVELRTKVSDQAHTIELLQQELDRVNHHYQLARQFQDETEPRDQEVARLKKLLDYERRFLSETKAYTFKAWLRKHPSSPWRDRFVSDQLVPAKTSRTMYQAQMKRLECTEEEMEDFIRLWKLMLTERS